MVTYRKTVQLGTFSVIYNNWLPYATGCLISYCKNIQAIADRYTFLDPIYKQKPVHEYKKILKNVDILGLTCYVWNQSYNNELARFYKKLRPDGVVVYGGPQIPEDAALKIVYDKEHPHDHSIAGLAEIAFAEWLLDLQQSKSVLKEMPIPYLDGTFDNILKTEKKIKVSFETNRGCPYSCSFCDWGGQARSKIIQFDHSQVKQTIDKIYQYSNIDELEILDANFGMFSHDVEVIDYMINRQNFYNNHLRISYSGLAKNGSKHLPSIMEKIFDNLPIDQRNLKISFQTHTKDVLQIVGRENINNEKLFPLIKQFQQKNIPTTSEMIIALPGETAETWLQTLHYNYHKLSIDFVRAYILHVVPNTPLYNSVLTGNYKTKKVIYKNNAVEILVQDLKETKLMFSYFWIFNTFINTHLATVQSVYNDVKIFYQNINNMPFIKSLLDDYLKIVETVFVDDKETTLQDNTYISFFTNTLRGNEITYILENQDTVYNEIKDCFNVPTTKWQCNNPKGAITTIC